MQMRFVTEAVMLAIYGNLSVPEKPVEYLIPSSTIHELYEFMDSPDPIMPDLDDEEVRKSIKALIEFFENPFYAKKISSSLVAPWRKSPPLPVNDKVSVTVVYAMEAEEFGEAFNIVETELILTAQYEEAPLLTDQIDLIDRMLEAGIPAVVVDIDDFEYAVESGLNHHFE